MSDELVALHAYIHVLEERVRKFEARERILISRTRDPETYERIFAEICDICDGPHNEVFVEVTPLGMQCAMCDRMCCITCCGIGAAECNICHEWICSTCVGDDPRRKVRRILSSISGPDGPTFAYNRYMCGRHETGYTPPDDAT
jgi:hypothetical protein